MFGAGVVKGVGAVPEQRLVDMARRSALPWRYFAMKVADWPCACAILVAALTSMHVGRVQRVRIFHVDFVLAGLGLALRVLDRDAGAVKPLRRARITGSSAKVPVRA